MPRNREWLIDRVSARVDSVQPEGENVGGQTGIEAPSLIIDDELDFSAHYVLRTGKLALIYPAVIGDLKHFHGSNVNDVDTRLIIEENKQATIPCPQDFLRFVACRLSSWKRDLKEVIHQSHPKYRFQEGNPHTSGNPYKPEGAMVSFYEYEAGELNQWTIDYAFITNQSVEDLDNDDVNIATGEIFTLSAQTIPGENGTYLCNASGTPPTKLSNSVTTINSGTAIECYRAASVNDTLTKFHYIPRLNAEEMPDDLIDPMIWHCAGRVLESMGRMQESTAAMQKADALLGNLKVGIKGEV
jgi:hypothetical protein